MVNVWRLVAFNERDHQQQMIQWATNYNRIAIGWSVVGNLIQFTAPENIQNQVSIIFGGPNNPGGAPTAGIQLWNFRGGAHPFYPRSQGGPHPHFLAIQYGDLVILKTRKWSQSVVMRVQGPYLYVPHVPINQPPYGYRHQRNAQVTDIDPEGLWNEAGRLPGVQALHQNWRQNALVLCRDRVGC